MGSVNLNIGDGTARFKKPSLCSSSVNLLMIFSIVTTNVFALYAFTYHSTSPRHISIISEKISLILKEIESSQKKLTQMEKHVLGYESINLSNSNVTNELKEFLIPHRLPLGKDSKTGITEMVASIGHSCVKSMDLLSKFMAYEVNGVCPDDWILAQKLIISGCEPLPRRRCFARTIPKVGLQRFPDSLWSVVSEKIYSWSGLGCKNLACLNAKKLNKDCSGCFDITKGYETIRYLRARSKNDFLIDDVLDLGHGGIRIGFDIGGGSGTFAARMAERNVTIVTATLNLDAPFNDFIAARGVFPLHVSMDQRFPFSDNVFDLVHAANAMDVGGRSEKLEFLLFDIDRVLKGGGLFWMDNFVCENDDKKQGGLALLVEKFGYKKLKWEKSSGSDKSQVYLSAVLQKPIRL